ALVDAGQWPDLCAVVGRDVHRGGAPRKQAGVHRHRRALATCPRPLRRFWGGAGARRGCGIGGGQAVVNNMSTARESRMHENRLRAQVSGTLERTDGAVLRWWRSGRGEPLVLVHGSFDDHNGWTPVLPMLTQHADVISYDRR